MLIAYLVDAGELDPRATWRSFEEGSRAGPAEDAAKLGWDQLKTAPGIHRFDDMTTRTT